MMTDDMIRSMKEQMTPSDDVVTDLLAKIAALDASPASSEHVVSFDDARIRKACEDLTASQGPAAKAKKHTTKSIWYYSTAAVAGVIVLLSTFTIFGSADGNRAWDFIHTAINDPAVVTSPNHPDTDTPAVTDTTEPDGSDSSDDSELQVQEDENQGGFLQNLSAINSRSSRIPRIPTAKTANLRIRVRTRIMIAETAARLTPISQTLRLRRSTLRMTGKTPEARILATAIPVRLPRLLRMMATAIMLSVTAKSRLARPVPRISRSTVKFSPKVQFQT